MQPEEGQSQTTANPREWRATLCDMRTVTHREMRNQSGDILRHVADGETIQVTNHGRVAALIVPPGADPTRGSHLSGPGARSATPDIQPAVDCPTQEQR